MKLTTKLYKCLSQKDFENLKVRLKRNYYYLIDGEKKIINEQLFENDNSKGIYQLFDDDFEWNPKEQSLFLNLTLTADNLNSLFGEQGFCSPGAVLGIGLVWKPERSKIKRCFKLAEITSEKNSLDVNVENIELQNITSNVQFDLVIYVVKPSTSPINPFFANEEGMVLYSGKSWTIVVEGNGSIFPVYEIEDANGPIWSYYCDFIDISEDSFDLDHVQIKINKKHPAYSLVHPKSPTYSQEYVNEILSSALTMIIIDIRSKQDNNVIDLEEDGEEGSILTVIKYFNDTLKFKINGTYNELLESVKTFFDKEM